MTPESRHADIARYFRSAFGVYLFVLVLALYTGTKDPTGDIKWLISAWATAGLGIGWILAVWRAGLPVRPVRLFPGVFLALLALYALSALFSEFRWRGLIETGVLLQWFVLYLVASQVFDKISQVRRLMLVVCIAVACASIFGLMQKVGLDPFPWDDKTSDVYQGAPATFGHPNFAAHTIILTVIMLLFLIRTGLSWRIGGPVFALLLLHLFITGQRGGILALAGASVLIVSVVLLRKYLRRPLTGVITAFIVTGLLSVLGAGGGMAISKWRTGTLYPLDPSILIRYQSYVSAVDMALDKPLLGYGPAVYGIAYPTYWTTFEQEWFAQKLRMNEHVHNDLLEVAIDAGIPAASLYFVILLLGIINGLFLAYTARDKERRWLGYTFSAFFMAFFIDGLFGFNLRVPVSAALFGIMLGLLEGIWHAGRPAYRPDTSLKSAQGALAAALVVNVLLASLVFGSQVQLYQGMRAQSRLAFAEARDHYASGRRLAPWDMTFERRLGQTYLAEQRVEDAIYHFNRALERNPYYIITHLYMAKAKMLQAQEFMQRNAGNIEGALAIFSEATKHLERMHDICPMFPNSHDLMARIASASAAYVLASDLPAKEERAETYWRKAEAHLLEAIHYELENQGELYRTLGKVRIALGDDDGAGQALERAVRADPLDMEVWPLYIDIASKQKRYDRVRNTLWVQIHRLEAMEDVDMDVLATAYLFLANVLEIKEEKPTAIEEAYYKAVQYAPKRLEVWANYARYVFQHNRVPAIEAAVAQSCALLGVQGEPPLPHVAAVNAVLQHGVPALQRATEALLSAVRAYRPLANLNAEQAYGWAAQLLLNVAGREAEDTPGVCPSYLNLGIAVAGMGNLSLADQLFEKAHGCLEETRQPFLAIHWADALVRLGREPEALAMLQTACEAYPDNFEARWTLARLYGRKNMIPEARREYQNLLQENDLDPKGRAMLEQELNRL